jgi:hypothetical protein
MKGHTLYCHHHASAARPSRRGVAGRKIHLRHQLNIYPPTMSPAGFVSEGVALIGIAVARTVGFVLSADKPSAFH